MDVNAKALNEGLQEVADAKGIEKEDVVEALQEAITKAYIKYLGGGDDAVVTCSIDTEKGKISLAQIKRVVKDVEDDYLEIAVEDANAGLKKAKYNVGDDFAIEAPVAELSKLFAMSTKNFLRAKISEREKSALYEKYKDRIGELITGTVEKSDDRSISVNIGRTTVELDRRALIGDETYKIGDTIKVYLQEVKPSKAEEGKPTRGPLIEATRSSEGFLKRIFEQEISEVYQGSVVIKKIAREAGIRSKVAVYSTNEDVDATGACIGAGGVRIQKVVSCLGNGKDKEKIDVINYSEEPAVFIMEALRPATVLGVALYERESENENPKALAVIKDGQLSIAIGRKAANARLASKITGYSIDIKEESQAKADGLEYTASEEWIAKADAAKRNRDKEAFLAKTYEEAAKRAEAAKKAEEEAKPVAPKATAKPEDFPEEAINPAAAALAQAKQEDAQKAALEEAPKKEEPVAPRIEKAEVKTTVSLDDLEKELEAAKEKKSQPVKAKKPRKITEKEVERPSAPKSDEHKPQMAVYTQEELDAIAEEDAEKDSYDYEDEEIDYEDYDQYYDDDEGGRR